MANQVRQLVGEDAPLLFSAEVGGDALRKGDLGMGQANGAGQGGRTSNLDVTPDTRRAAEGSSFLHEGTVADDAPLAQVGGQAALAGDRSESRDCHGEEPCSNDHIIPAR